DGDVIHHEHLPQHLTERLAQEKHADSRFHPPSDVLTGNLPEALRVVEEQMINQAMNETEGNILRAAKLLGIPRQTLQYKLN
ncbi:hypothetical protein MXD81_26340, partial [Microbacteriaceae bacterium K1510]|nr:hypothetical protein [Microbacteriaceae bacterium K1510]